LPADLLEQLLLQKGHVVITRSLPEAIHERETNASAPVVWIYRDTSGESTPESTTHPSVIALRISTRDSALADTIASSIENALTPVDTIERARVVAISSMVSFDQRRQKVPASLVLLPLRSSNLRALGEVVEACRVSGCRGVQIVWDGHDPAPSRVERRVFAVLEQARSTPSLAPVWIATSRAPLFHLLPPRPRTDEELHAHV
jgi:hypothetical protein